MPCMASASGAVAIVAVSVVHSTYLGSQNGSVLQYLIQSKIDSFNSAVDAEVLRRDGSRPTDQMRREM